MSLKRVKTCFIISAETFYRSLQSFGSISVGEKNCFQKACFASKNSLRRLEGNFDNRAGKSVKNLSLNVWKDETNHTNFGINSFSSSSS